MRKKIPLQGMFFQLSVGQIFIPVKLLDNRQLNFNLITVSSIHGRIP